MTSAAVLTCTIDQLGATCADLADMTVAFHKRLKSLSPKVRDELVQELGVRLIVTFLSLPEPKESD